MAECSATIPEFFAGKNVFVTGATGFLGKALVEKLLRSCPGIGTIYVLMRAKRNKGLAERLVHLQNDMLFERLKQEQPDLVFEQKVVPVEGDMMLQSLGLSPANRQLITENVHVIFHVAASVRFDDSLRDAVFMNVRGTRDVCQLANDTKTLMAYVHVSTAFANCDKSEALEILYPPKADWQQSIEIAEKFDSELLAIMTEKYMDGMPNTYCFTKNMAEHVVHDMCLGKIPAVIVRPSIVINSLREEPVAGWVDNFNGPIGLMTAYGKGIMRTVYAHDHYKPDYIPVDIVTKVLVVAAWDRVHREFTPSTPADIIHCTSHTAADWIRPSIGRMATCAARINSEVPLNDIMWYPSNHTTNSTLMCYVRTVLFMLLPAILADGILYATGRKPMLLRLQRKMYTAQLALRYFMTNEWTYVNDGLLLMRKRILANDMSAWDYDFAHFDFGEYVRQSILGCRRYLLREPDETLPKAQAHYRRMYWLHMLVQLSLYTLIIWIVCKSSFAQNTFQLFKSSIQF